MYSMTKLYELAPQVAALLAIEDLDQQTITDTLESLGFDDKVSGCVALIKSLDAEAEMYSKEALRLQGRKKATENKADSLRNYVLSCMQLAGVKKAGSQLHGATVSQSSREIVVIDNIELLPADLTAVTVTASKALILDAIKAGKDIKGAHLEPSKPSLRIK